MLKDTSILCIKHTIKKQTMMLKWMQRAQNYVEWRFWKPAGSAHKNEKLQGQAVNKWHSVRVLHEELHDQ